MLRRLFGAVLLLAVCAGCSRSGAESSGRTTLRVWSMWSGGEEQAFESILREYERLHPVIRIENLGAIRDDTKTVRAIVAGDPPDLFTLSDPLYLGPLAAQGAIERLDAWFREAGLREEQFVPASLSQCRYEGGLYAMPYLIDDYALLWNKKAFREAGLDPERPPKTLEELEEYALKLTKRAPGGEMTQMGLAPISNRSFYAGEIFLFFYLFGGGLYDSPANRITADHPGNVRALEWYANMVDQMGGAQRMNAFAAGFGQPQGGNNPFFMGKIAMMINGQWNTYWAHLYAPNLEFGVAPIPYPSGRPELKRPTWFGGNMFCIPKGSPNALEAWRLLSWMQTHRAQILFAQTMHGVPNLRTALKAKELRTGKPYRALFAKFLDLGETPNGFHFPAIPVANLYSNQIYDAVDYVINHQKTARQALEDVQTRVQRELDRFQ